MYAVVFDEPGAADVLHWREIPDLASPKPGEVLLEVAASAVNRADIMQRQGHYPPPPGAPEILGLECSGRIKAVGDGVVGWTPGDEVCALLAGGGYATSVVVPAGQLMPVPDGLELLAAGGFPEVACTVYSNIFSTGQLTNGETLLVHGGSSGIGTMAIQMVRALRPDVRICVTAGSQAKLDRCRDLGADVAINYREDDFVERVKAETDGRGADVVLDNMGAKYLARNVDVLAVDGRLVIIGLQGGTKGELNLGALLAKRGTLAAKSLRSRPPEQKAAICAGVVREAWPAVVSGQIRPVIDRVLPMSEPVEAHRVVESSEHIGKVLLAVP